MLKVKFSFFILLLGLILISSGCVLKQKVSVMEEAVELEAATIVKTTFIETTLELDYSEREIQVWEIVLTAEQTVFDQLHKASQDYDFSLEYEQGEWGVFIKQIGQKKNGQDNKYWQYWVNDEFAPVAADQYKLIKSDRVKWQFAESQF